MIYQNPYLFLISRLPAGTECFQSKDRKYGSRLHFRKSHQDMDRQMKWEWWRSANKPLPRGRLSVIKEVDIQLYRKTVK